jgi:hypothetical protein
MIGLHGCLRSQSAEGSFFIAANRDLIYVNEVDYYKIPQTYNSRPSYMSYYVWTGIQGSNTWTSGRLEDSIDPGQLPDWYYFSQKDVPEHILEQVQKISIESNKESRLKTVLNAFLKKTSM